MRKIRTKLSSFIENFKNNGKFYLRKSWINFKMLIKNLINFGKEYWNVRKILKTDLENVRKFWRVL